MWEKTLAYCNGGYGEYNNFEEAQEACKKDSNCAAIYDAQCNYEGCFSLCPLGYTEEVSSSSCLYVYSAGTVMIKALCRYFYLHRIIPKAISY